MFEKRVGHDGGSTQILKDIISRVDSLDQMMKDLLLFARPPKPKRALTDVASLVTTTARLLSGEPLWRHVDVVVDGAVPPVQAHPEMLKIVFQNLLINGAHAMQGNGRILVAIHEVNTMCQVAFSDAALALPPTCATKSSGPSLRRSHAAPAWAFPPPSGSSTRTTARSPSIARRREARDRGGQDSDGDLVAPRR